MILTLRSAVIPGWQGAGLQVGAGAHENADSFMNVR